MAEPFPNMLLVAFLWTCFDPAIPQAQATTKESHERISIKEAAELVRAAVKQSCSGCDVSSIEVAPLQDKYDSSFYYFSPFFDSPKVTGSPNAGYYAVNPRTGDVWDTAICKKLNVPSIKEKQREIRERLKSRKRERNRPLCNNE